MEMSLMLLIPTTEKKTSLMIKMMMRIRMIMAGKAAKQML